MRNFACYLAFDSVKIFYKILRALLVSLIVIAVTVPALLFVALSLPSVQGRIARVAERELSTLLGAQVSIESLKMSPFNRAMLRDVTLTVEGDTVLTAKRIGGGVNVMELLRHRRVVINYVELIGAKASVWRATPEAPYNIQPIMDALTKKQPRKQSAFQLGINTVLIRNLEARYDVLSAPEPEPGRFSADHIAVSDFNADVVIPTVGRTAQDVKIKRLRLRERSGLEITDLKGVYIMSPTILSLEGLTFEMPRSYLEFSDLTFRRDEGAALSESLLNTPLSLTLSPESHITPADLAPLFPPLAKLVEPADVELDIDGTISGATRVTFDVYDTADRYTLAFYADLTEPLDSAARRIDGLHLTASATSPFIREIAGEAVRLPAAVDSARYVTVDIEGALSASHVSAEGELSTDAGRVAFEAGVSGYAGRRPHFDFSLSSIGLDAGRLTGNPDLGLVALTTSGEGILMPRRLPAGGITLSLDTLDWRGRRLTGVEFDGEIDAKGNYHIVLESGDPLADFNISAAGIWSGGEKMVSLDAVVNGLDMALAGPRPGTLSLRADVDLFGNSVDDIQGTAAITDISFTEPDGKRMAVNTVRVVAAGGVDAPDRILSVYSDLLDARIQGKYYVSTLVPQLREIAMQSFPALRDDRKTEPQSTDNRFKYRLTVKDLDEWTSRMDYGQLPVSVLGTLAISGNVDYPARNLRMNLDLPYLRQGNKLIDSTQVIASVDGSTGRSILYITSDIPTKEGYMRFNMQTKASHDEVGTRLWWNIKRDARYDGDISLDASISRIDGRPAARINLLPGEATFNDSTWTVNPAVIDVKPGRVTVDGIDVRRSGQYVTINGVASADTLDVIDIGVLNINLDYIFESLGLDKVLIGGNATGNFYASNLLSKEPHLETPGVEVTDVSYNKVVLGDAVARSHWDGREGAVILDVDIAPHDGGRHSRIDGALYPLKDSLDLKIDANNVNVAFMKPYMQAFTSDVSGRGTGKVHLFGTFKFVDITGEVYGEDIRLKVDFTNTYYTTSDMIRMTPGEIRIDRATVRDDRGQTGVLSGVVRHKYFGQASFDFSVTDVDGMLVYDEPARTGADWYGRVFGYGDAHISGEPGEVNINVNLRTAPGSTFTYVNNDMKVASNYDFITFRDRGVLAFGETETLEEQEPATVRTLRELMAGGPQDNSDDYNITLQVEITPQAQINMIMDPDASDIIRSNGTGTLQIGYESRTDHLGMVGKYVLEKGKYNFTLQDIIIKDFSIRRGSRIEFNGDPYKAQLDITTALTINANLSDLDESFLQDRELNRTKVPVDALVMVKGPLQEPEITYDIDFPTLNEDTKRKINSIISTDEMKSTQIIYLLALERFYTPDYMGGTTSGSELMSVASSTISSQLRNMLGHLADNWNIAPSIRSDKRDFSDVEVDVGLSSSLLNNRLLFNGNFGYRDKSLNSTQFVGDFDIEYLLNNAGTWRLKAYNRFNDQNNYLRSAETTQGVGIAFRRSFDGFRSLLGIKKKSQPADSTATAAPADTTAVPLARIYNKE